MLTLAIIISLLVFTAVILLSSRVDKSGNVRDRVRRLTPQTSPSDVNPEEVSLTLEEEPSPLVSGLESVLSAIGVPIEQYKLDHQTRFQQAGLTSPSAPTVYLFFKYIVSGLFALLGVAMMMAPLTGMERLLAVMCGLFCIILGVIGPDLYVKNATQKRQQVLQRSFPDALDLLLVCVESGLALDGALARVCRELGRAHPEITGELNRTRMELTLLNNRQQALQNLSDRTGLLPFRSLVASLLQSERFGTNLTETLRVLAEDYRMQRLMAAENKAGRLPVMMTIPLICFMMPAFFLIIMGPAILGVIEVFHNR
jgi:tight adherence protein C